MTWICDVETKSRHKVHKTHTKMHHFSVLQNFFLFFLHTNKLNKNNRWFECMSMQGNELTPFNEVIPKNLEVLPIRFLPCFTDRINPSCCFGVCFVDFDCIYIFYDHIMLCLLSLMLMNHHWCTIGTWGGRSTGRGTRGAVGFDRCKRNCITEIRFVVIFIQIIS